MVTTPAANTERHATGSPFGLMADLGCAFAAQLGMPTVEIARNLGLGVTNETARAAVIRGRRELITRRIDPARVRVQPPGPTPSRAATAHAEVPETPAAAACGSPGPAAAPDDSIEALLRWAYSGPQRAGTRAAKVRALLGEIEEIQQASRKNQVKLRARRDQRREIIPADVATATEQRAYFQRVRAWARENGQPVREGRIVPTSTLRAYEAAHATQSTDEGDPHRPG